MKIPRPVEPVLAVEACHVDDQSVAFPVADGMTHVCVVRRRLDFIQVDRARRIGKCECHLNFSCALDDLERIRHVHCPWNAGQVTLQLRIAVDPVCAVLLFHRGRFWFVRNFATVLDHTHRSRYSGRGTKREHGCCRHASEFIARINTGLRHRSCACFVSLQVPIRFIVGLPDAAEVGLAVRRARRP